MSREFLSSLQIEIVVARMDSIKFPMFKIFTTRHFAPFHLLSIYNEMSKGQHSNTSRDKQNVVHCFVEVKAVVSKNFTT